MRVTRVCFGPGSVVLRFGKLKSIVVILPSGEFRTASYVLYPYRVILESQGTDINQVDRSITDAGRSYGDRDNSYCCGTGGVVQL